MAEKVGQFLQNVAQHFERSLVGVEAADELGRVELEQMGRLLLVDLHAGAEHFFVEIVRSLFNQGSSFHSLNKDIGIGGLQHDDVHHLDIGL